MHSAVSKDKLSSFKLRSDPSDASSPTYELSVRYYNDGTPEEWLLFLKAVKEVLRGQGITTGPPAFSMYRRLLKGDALAQFNAAATNMTESMANLTLVLQQVTTHVFPDKALVKQRVYMNRYLRKTMQVKMRQ